MDPNKIGKRTGTTRLHLESHRRLLPRLHLAMPDGSITECYAKTIAERFTRAYNHGFEHHYWRPHNLDAPLKVKESSGIFVGSMADLFGHWVPKEQIRSSAGTMRQARHWHTFQTLSKFPIRLPEVQSISRQRLGRREPERPRAISTAETGGARALSAYLVTLRIGRRKSRFDEHRTALV